MLGVAPLFRTKLNQPVAAMEWIGVESSGQQEFASVEGEERDKGGGGGLQTGLVMMR